MLEHYAIAFAAHASYDALKQAFKYVSQKRPDLEAAAQHASELNDKAAAERVFEEAIGVILADAGADTIKLDGATMTALRGIKFDHQHGQVTIDNSVVSADILVSGGSSGSTGQTTIGANTSLRSRGTSIEVGHGAKIQLTGGASIKQT